MPGMYRPRQSLRHTSGNKAATIQQLTLRQIRAAGTDCFDKKYKTAQGNIHNVWNKKISTFEKPLCYQFNCRRKNLKTPHLFEKFPCSESSCKWSRGSRYAFYQRMFFFTKTRKWFEAQHLLPVPVWRVKKLPTYQFISYSVADRQKDRVENYRACCWCCVLMSSLVGVVGGWDRSYFLCTFKINLFNSIAK